MICKLGQLHGFQKGHLLLAEGTMIKTHEFKLLPSCLVLKYKTLQAAIPDQVAKKLFYLFRSGQFKRFKGKGLFPDVHAFRMSIPVCFRAYSNCLNPGAN